MIDPGRMLWDSNIIYPHAGSVGWGLGSSKLLVISIGFRRGFGYILGHDEGVEIEAVRNVVLYVNQKTFLRPIAHPNMELRWGLLL